MVIRNLKDHISTVYWRRERFPFSSTTSPSTSSGVFKETKVYLIGLFTFWVNHAILFSDYISRKHTRTRKNTQTHTPTKTQQPTKTPQNHFLRMPWRIPICTSMHPFLCGGFRKPWSNKFINLCRLYALIILHSVPQCKYHRGSFTWDHWDASEMCLDRRAASLCSTVFVLPK